MKKLFCILIIAFLYGQTIYGQGERKHTLAYDSIAGSPQAYIEEVAWIQGHWSGEAFGGTTEEYWSPPAGESMMCVFKHMIDGVVNFYEICVIKEEDNSLILMLKHFDGSLKGWEEKEEVQSFKLVKLSESKAWFDGFTFEKVNEEEMNIYVLIEAEEGAEEMLFNYHRN